MPDRPERRSDLEISREARERSVKRVNIRSIGNPSRHPGAAPADRAGETTAERIVTECDLRDSELRPGFAFDRRSLTEELSRSVYRHGYSLILISSAHRPVRPHNGQLYSTHIIRVYEPAVNASLAPGIANYRKCDSRIDSPRRSGRHPLYPRWHGSSHTLMGSGTHVSMCSCMWIHVDAYVYIRRREF